MIAAASVAATELIRMSRCLTCASSCAEHALRARRRSASAGCLRSPRPPRARDCGRSRTRSATHRESRSSAAAAGRRAARSRSTMSIQAVAGADLLRVVHPQDDLVREPVRAEVRRPTAKRKPITSPPAPPSSSPMTSSSALISAEQQRRFHGVVHENILFRAAGGSACVQIQTREQARERAPPGRAASRCRRVRAARARRRRSAPRPSSVGTPSAAVKLPSDPPPVAPSPSSWPSSPRDLPRLFDTDAPQSRCVPAAAGRSHPRLRPSCAGPPAAARETRRRSGRRPPRVGTRTSTTAARLVRDDVRAQPPDTCTTLTRDAARQILQRLMRQIWCASSWTALAPFCGSMPAWAATPRTVTSILAAALARRLQRAARAATARARARRGCGAPRPRSPRATSRCRLPRRSSTA